MNVRIKQEEKESGGEDYPRRKKNFNLLGEWFLLPKKSDGKNKNYAEKRVEVGRIGGG